ncbi:hypothetical protein [Kitasatospora sp. NPDC091207]|uniref:hypothetical protein n=1 Tax=Kitasatospora sp. NPDC091207 TaxID=3364083 RepID=UPI0037FE68D7
MTVITTNEGTGPEPLGLCVVANVSQVTAHGDGGRELRAGLRHFAPGAKVWIAPPSWDRWDPAVTVVGRHRGNHRRNVTIVVQRRFLADLLVRGIYSPTLLAKLGGSWKADTADEFARFWGGPRLETRVEIGGRLRRAPPVLDPPPPEMEYEGTVAPSRTHRCDRRADRAVGRPAHPIVLRLGTAVHARSLV